MEQTNERTPASGMYVLAQLEGRKPEMGAACPSASVRPYVRRFVRGRFFRATTRE